MREEASRLGNEDARIELGQDYELVEIGEPTTMEGLMSDLAVHDRLDSMIDRCLKRLLLVRGVKSVVNVM